MLLPGRARLEPCNDGTNGVCPQTRRSAVNARLPSAVPIVADGARMEWGPAGAACRGFATGNAVESQRPEMVGS
jgi:hypothetical protein